MKGLIIFASSILIVLHNVESNPIGLNTDFIFGSIRNVTLGATSYISDTIQRQTDIILHAKDTATNYVSDAVAGPKKMLFDVKNATTEYIESTASKSMEIKVRSLLEVLRVQMPYGIPALNLPVLEPLKIEHMEITTTNKDIGNVSGVIDNVTISKLSTFVVDNVKLSIFDEVSLALNLSVPTLLADGMYEMSGKIGKIFTVNGTGPFNIEISGGHLYVHTVLGYSRSLYVKSVDLDFNVDSVKSFFHHLFPNDSVDKQMNQVVSDLVPEILECLKPDLKPILEEFFTQQVNVAVSRLSMGNLIGILTGTVDINTVPSLKKLNL